MSLRWKFVWQSSDGGMTVDAELVALLDAIADTRRLTTAAKRTGVSYRHAWGRLQDWSETDGHALVTLHQGRGADLTGTGERLRQIWHELAIALEQGIPALSDAYVEQLTALLDVGRLGELTIAASHGFAISTLRDELRARAGTLIEMHNDGSSRSLELLAAGRVDAAGFHLPLGALGLRLAPPMLDCLKTTRATLIVLESREQGFMCRRGTRFGSIADLAGGALRFVNRQPGAGSRLILDSLIQDAGLSTGDIRGYQDEEHTHSAVAALVSTRAADVAFGIRSAAEQFELVFVPVVRERYYLAIPELSRLRGWLERVRAVACSDEFKRSIERIPGTDVSDTGKILVDYDAAALTRVRLKSETRQHRKA